MESELSVKSSLPSDVLLRKMYDGHVVHHGRPDNFTYFGTPYYDTLYYDIQFTIQIAVKNITYDEAECVSSIYYERILEILNVEFPGGYYACKLSRYQPNYHSGYLSNDTEDYLKYFNIQFRGVKLSYLQMVETMFKAIPNVLTLKYGRDFIRFYKVVQFPAS